MSAKNFEAKIELVETALELLSEQRILFYMSDVYDVTGLSENGQNLSMIAWIAEQCGYHVFKDGKWCIRRPDDVL